MKKLFPLLFLFTGCVSFHYKIVGWYNFLAPDPAYDVLINNGQWVRITGNPRITCYNKKGNVIANGLFVKIDHNYLEVDEFGKRYILVKNNEGNFCSLWEQK